MKKDLLSSLDSHELIVLRIIGEWLDLNLTGERKRDCVKLIHQQMAQLDMELELKLLLPEEAAALHELIDSNGQLHVASYERLHGTVRQMGPGKLEREEPWLDPVSPAEALWYRGFIFRGFEEIEEDQIEEIFYIPDEFFSQLRSKTKRANDQAVRVQPVDETAIRDLKQKDALINMVDDMTTLIASAQINALQQDKLEDILPFLLQTDQHRLDLLFTLAWDMGLFRPVDKGAKPTRLAVEWLKKGREQQLSDLANSWRDCSWNELCITPGLHCEGSGWTNDEAAPRKVLSDALPLDRRWYDFNETVAIIKENSPDFQRPGGNYDTWYIRDTKSGDYLSGFESWDNVEGRLLRFLMEAPLLWLGLVNLRQAPKTSRLFFQMTDRGLIWLNGQSFETDEISVPIVVGNNGALFVPHNAIQYDRFQIARIADLVSADPNNPYEYWLTPTSLENARTQGIEPSRLLDFLREASGRPVPAGTRRAIERWNEQGYEAKIEQSVVLRVKDASILEKLRENPKTQIYIAETLGDLAAVIRPGDWVNLRQAAAQLGLLVDNGKIDDSG